ncbi:MAG: RnfABCDGE type electron transport complex subunit B [Phycisphaerae bacterium]
MGWIIIILAAGTMLLLAVIMSYVLGRASIAWHVEEDPRVEQVLDALPGANCGGCGYANCHEYADAVVSGEADIDLCSVGGVSCMTALAKILGVSAEPSWPKRPIVHCRATFDDRLRKSPYSGEQTCSAANLVAGVQGCTYGCLGLGDCERSCPFDAIHVIGGLAVVDYEKCTGCGNCAEACPRNIISMVPFKAEQVVAIACSNQDPGKAVRAVCKVGCIGCGLCAKASELFAVDDNLARLDYEAYDPSREEELLAAAEKCPMKSIIRVGKPSQEDIDATDDEQLPQPATADFETTADQAPYRG